MAGGDRFEGRPEPGVGVDAVQFRRLDQRRDPAPGGGALVVTREQRVFRFRISGANTPPLSAEAAI